MGWTMEETRALVSIWGQANIQNEIDGVARNTTIFSLLFRGLRGSCVTVDKQYTAEEKATSGPGLAISL